ncbi:protein of unknown function [Rhizobiales bacterium GAS191]|nr:protein of unknown function [Rhizobiales bacterium GAS191]
MDCPHCGKAFHDTWKEGHIVTIDPQSRAPTAWTAIATICPACNEPTIVLRQLNAGFQPPKVIKSLRVYPMNTFRKPTPTETPADIKEDYEEAGRVLPISNKASAALSRRCLQAVLRGQGYAQRDLAQQIDALLHEPDPAKAIPTALRETVDAIRNFGNFSAHPVTDQTTLQVIEVEDGEAEWCLDILEEMFDHYYVRPALAKSRKAALDAKLAAAGKPPSK